MRTKFTSFWPLFFYSLYQLLILSPGSISPSHPAVPNAFPCCFLPSIDRTNLSITCSSLFLLYVLQRSRGKPHSSGDGVKWTVLRGNGIVNNVSKNIYFDHKKRPRTKKKKWWKVYQKGWTTHLYALFVVRTIKIHKFQSKTIGHIPSWLTSLISCLSASTSYWGWGRGAGFPSKWVASAGGSPAKQSSNKNHAQSLGEIVCEMPGNRTKKLAASKEYRHPHAPLHCTCVPASVLLKTPTVLQLQRCGERNQHRAEQERFKFQVY